MCDDSFDIEELDRTLSQKTITAWTSHIAPKAKGRRTYSRRGSAFSSMGKSSTARNQMNRFEPHEDDLEGCLSPPPIPAPLALERSGSLPTFMIDTKSTIPGRRRFTRANSMSGSNYTESVRPQPPPFLRRAYSVSRRSSLGSTQRSSSLSSGIDSFSDCENFHPNFEPLGESISPKREAKSTVEFRGRKKVRKAKDNAVADKTPLKGSQVSHSFSNLARFGEEGISWAKQNTSGTMPFTSGAPGLTDMSFSEFIESSPAASSICSRRKRGIFESPLDDFDDFLSPDYSDRHSSNSRPRPRLFSPPPARSCDFSMGSVGGRDQHFAEFSIQSIENKKKREMDAHSDDGESGMESGDDASVESSGLKRSPVPTFVPHSQRRITTFGGTFNLSSEALDPDIATVNDVVETMPSYFDLRFLTKELRKAKESRGTTWHVVPPKAWQSNRRTKFLQWCTRTLGFTLRSGGMSISYINMSKTKGAKFLKLFESSLKSCKERGVGSKTPRTPHVEKSHFDFAALSCASSAAKIAISQPKELTSNSWPMDTEVGNQLDEDLMDGMTNLGFKENSRFRTSFDGNMVQSSIIVEDPNDLSDHDPRPSLENHTTAQDLMAHLHGMTPIPRSRRRPPRLSLQSVGSVSTAGASSKFSAASPHPQMTISVKNSAMTSTSFDCLETPMVKPHDQGWGSCPIEGRDWGTSEPCDPVIIEEYTRRFEQSRLEAGFNDSAGATVEEDSILFRSSSLDLELEAASSYRDSSESPESNSGHATTPGEFMFSQSSSYSSPSEGYSASTPVGSQFNFGAVSELRNRANRRRQTSFAKHQRMSLFAAAAYPSGPVIQTRKSLFCRPPKSNFPSGEAGLERLQIASSLFCRPETIEKTSDSPLSHDNVLRSILRYLDEGELLGSASLVCSRWFEISTHAHADLMLMSVGCGDQPELSDDDSDDESLTVQHTLQENIPGLLERGWEYLVTNYPWACFLSEGAYKRVYKVFNDTHQVEEAISVMDVNLIESTGNMNVVGAELAVSVMLSSLIRRGVCPNYVMTRGVFSCKHEPPSNHWGSALNKRPRGSVYNAAKARRAPREPASNKQGRYQYIRMELCDSGDAEEFLKTQADTMLHPEEARKMLFQISFALHAAADRFSLKHYDVKLLNIFLQRVSTEKTGDVVMRYGLGEHIFALRSAQEDAIVAKLADYGTANIDSDSSGQQVTIAQFTTLENTPPDFMLLGDEATQGHGHDSFGLGLCMLHLFTGHAPYEEILEEVECPPNLKSKLQEVWECEDEDDFSVLRSVILADVYKDEEGHIIEGEPDDVLYDTLYRFLVLFGIPDVSSRSANSKVLATIKEVLEGTEESRKKGKTLRKGKKRGLNDVNRFNRHRRKYSVTHGNNKYIARARAALEAFDGGMELLHSLVDFDPLTRATALDVLNSTFMSSLRESEDENYSDDDEVFSYMAFSTQSIS